MLICLFLYSMFGELNQSSESITAGKENLHEDSPQKEASTIKL